MSRTHKGHQARKRFGQNFLHDDNVIRNIVKSIRPKVGDNMVEIGPGMGAITEHLLDATEGHLNVVELDRDLIPGLKVKFFNHAGFVVNEADALQFDFQSLKVDERPLRIVGNLPYNISTPLIFHLLSYADTVQDMHFMLQKEVVQRMASGPGENNYGRLSIMAQYFCDVQHMFDVGPEAFQPAPKVDSAIVRLVPHKILPHPVKNHKTLENIVRQSFSMRRKTLRNNLKKTISDEQLSALGIDAGLRPERLSLADFVKIADFVFENSEKNNG
ncbi:MAG: 16S rRNA (adenine1518-N6/adenine1519-N6)-dimethyltransferase [Psychrobacter glaciei]|jgi:16S rRNA (adenine1518-N6/adenine1519-N6)-dimethyltransferase